MVPQGVEIPSGHTTDIITVIHHSYTKLLFFSSFQNDNLKMSFAVVKGTLLWGLCCFPAQRYRNGVGSRAGAVVIALAFHQCGPGSITGLDVIMWIEFVVGSFLSHGRFLKMSDGLKYSRVQLLFRYIRTKRNSNIMRNPGYI